MIDIENANIEFGKYILQFNPDEGRIKLKIDHIKRVAIMSRKLAQNLHLSDEQVKLAELIGLFHDIGRFKQAELYNTFNDRISVNHAELSIKVLFDENLINNFNVEEKYKKIIRLAVLNHNKNKIDDNLNEEEMLFAKIIRDSDQIPIFYAYIFDFYFDFSLIFLKEKKYLDRFTNRIYDNFTNNTVKQQVKQILQISNNFLNTYSKTK